MRARMLAAAIVAALAVSTLSVLGPSAGAAVPAKSFCDVLTSTNQSDLQGLNPDSSDFAIKQIKKLLKTKAPKKVKKALKTIKKYYERIADGDVEPTDTPPGNVITAFTTFSTYAAKHCD